MPESSTRTVQRALTLLAAVCEQGNASLAEAAREADLSASTALRLMRTLESSGFLARSEDGMFRPGPWLIRLGAKTFSREMLIPLSHEPMESVVDATGESVYLSVPGLHETAMYIAIVEGTFSVRHTNWVGRTVPMEGSAAGQVLRGETPETGYVVLQNTVEDDVTAICAPISVGGHVVAAMSTLVPTYRLDEQRQRACGIALVEATARVSEALGDE